MGEETVGAALVTAGRAGLPVLVHSARTATAAIASLLIARLFRRGWGKGSASTPEAKSCDNRMSG